MSNCQVYRCRHSAYSASAALMSCLSRIPVAFLSAFLISLLVHIWWQEIMAWLWNMLASSRSRQSYTRCKYQGNRHQYLIENETSVQRYSTFNAPCPTTGSCLHYFHHQQHHKQQNQKQQK